MPNRKFLSLITGPGNHASYLIRALQEEFDFDFTAYWPQYKHSSGGTDLSHSRLYDFASFILYAAYNRLRFLKQNKWHQDILLTLYDQINSKKIEGKNLIAWPQVSLHTMSKVKSNGGKIIFEQPMCHVDFWNSVSREEHNKLSIPDSVSFTKFMTGRMKKEYQLADRIIVHSHFAKKTFVDQQFPKNKITVCPLGIDIPKIDLSIKRKGGKLQVLYVGRVEILKGVHYLLEAADAFEKYVDVHIAGSIQSDFLNIAKKYEGKVKFYGQLPKERIAELYKQSDVLIFPSLYDAFGLTIIEAMSYGTPVIASAHSAGPDIITDYVDGFVVPPFSSESLVEKIEMILRDKDLLQSMRHNARSKVETLYSFKEYAKRATSVIKESFKLSSLGEQAIS